MVKDLKKTLSDAISRSIRAVQFCCGGSMSINDPGIDVKNVGVLRFPLKPKSVKSLVQQCQIAPFGKGTETLVDTEVRKTFELSPENFQLSDAWNSAIKDVTRTAAVELGLPPDELEAKLYKLLVYQAGGFFLPHQDSEKGDGMLASLVVVLPNEFNGGSLSVRHGPREQYFFFGEAKSGKAPSYAAFYADCEHDVSHVHSGARICLAYNLILHPKKTSPGKSKKDAAELNLLEKSIQTWFAAHPSRPLVFAMEHRYSERGLSAELLKGTDRSLLKLLIPAAEEAKCLIHLTQVSRHLCQYADDGSYGNDRRRYWRDAPQKPSRLEIGETYNDELTGGEWTDLSGNKQPWGEMPFHIASIVSPIPIEDWKPTSEEYEGYTGNAGNTLDRWYHRSALVLWPASRHFTVLATSGPAVCIPLFLEMTSKLSKVGKLKKSALRSECIEFALAIISTWPTISPRNDVISTGAKSRLIFDEFRDRLLELNDLETIVALLSRLAVCDQTTALKKLVIHACGEFGIAALASALRALMTPVPDLRWRQDIAVRDMEWLSALCQLPPRSEADHEILRGLCRQAVAAFCLPDSREGSPRSREDRSEETVAEAALPHLLKALLACGCDDEFSQVVGFVERHSEKFTLEFGQAPTLKDLVHWSRKRSRQVSTRLLNWLESVRNTLTTATASEPEPPADWARQSRTSCRCQHCEKLSAFLQDATAEIGRIPAREDIRDHLIWEIRKQGLDVTSRLEKKGSPYSLVLTKTQESFERDLKRYRLNCKLLKSLPSVDEKNASD